MHVLASPFFIASGVRFDLNALFSSATTVARVPLFLLALLLARVGASAPGCLEHERRIGCGGGGDVNPRREAYERLGGRYDVRVLEPSPPAIAQPPWFADDPPARGDTPPGRQVVSPVGTGDLRWEDLAVADEELAAWCSERWLAAYPRLQSTPPRLVETRLALHRLAEQVVSPARRAANGKIGLRYTRGGFGTPFFGADTQVRVEGAALIVQSGDEQRRAPITTLAAAAEHVGGDVLPGDVEFDDTSLEVDLAAAAFLGEWYGFAASVLEELRAEAPAAAGASRVQLWPEHFDLALELGAESRDARAAYGLSPGDEPHAEPYLYVAPWVAQPEGELWQASGFSGAELPYAELLSAHAPREAALDFFRARLAALTA
jgi:hypothetical protein